MRPPAGRTRGLTDAGAVVLALAVVGGALVAAPVPLAVASVLAGLALASRRAAAVWLAAGLLASGLAARAWQGLVPTARGAFHGEVTLVADPETAFGGWRVDVRGAGHRYEAVAHGAAAASLRARQWGDRLVVRGRLEPLGSSDWTVARHLAGRLVIDRVERARDGGPAVEVVNGVRALLRDGAAALPASQRPLFLGFVLGDDRGSSVAVADDFAGAGLTHLLVVSGQNVAFVLAVAAPVLRRFGLRGRLALTLGLLGLFAALTRFEPSVLRATAMAALAAVGVTVGRPASTARLLSLAVAGLVLVDPLLVHSLGFRLSVAATAGIVVLSGPLRRALPGPSVLTGPLSVTLAAQAAVAPLLVPAFGPMPVAAVPANVAAEPVAGLVMMWGSSAGLLAGLVPPLAPVLHLPTRLGLWWVATVARVGAAAPLGGLGLVAVAVVVAAAALGVLAVRRGRRGLAAVASVLALAPVAAALPFVGRDAVPAEVDVGGAELWRAGGVAVLVVPGTASAAGVLAGVRRADVRHLDLVIATSPGVRAAEVVTTVRSRVEVGEVWAPTGSPLEGATTPPPGGRSRGGVRVEVAPAGDRLDVVVRVEGGNGPG